MNKILLTLLIGQLSFGSFAKVATTPDYTPNKKQEEVVGNIVKKALEVYHMRKMEIDSSVSKKAFKEYLKKVDFSKQFLTQADVKTLKKYEAKMSDHMVTGDYVLLNKTIQIMVERIKETEKFRDEFFKKGFDLTKKETIELDPEKRDFAKNEKARKELWRKTFKHSILSRTYTLIEEQEELKNPKKNQKNKKDKKKKNKKKEKILTRTEIDKKALDLVSKKYKRYFERQLQETRNDYFEKFYNSIAGIFDPHTSYLPPKRKEDFDIDISGQLEGIGAVLQENDGYIKVVSIVPGGAAWRQKELEVDDLILSVSEGEKKSDPVDLVGMRVEDAVRYIRGKKDTTVKLHVKKADGTRKVIAIQRDVVSVGESFAKSSVLQIKGEKAKIGYIQLPKFYRDFENPSKNCTEDVRMEIRRLKKQKVDTIILDLRNNGGGALEDAREMSGLFIKSGPIVQVKSHNGEIEVKRDTDPGVEYNGPLIVLVNRFSASASEILAGAMQDYKRAIIVGGENTHGKGTVQAVINLNQGALMAIFKEPILGALKVTIQKFYRVNGDSTQYKGVTPDIILPDPLSYIENREQDLEYSLPWDKVKQVNYSKWDKYTYDYNYVSKRSKKRVSKDKWFKKIQKSTDYLVSRKDETRVTLNLKQYEADEKKHKKLVEDLKIEPEFKDLIVSHYEGSLKAHEKIKPGEEKQWEKDFEQRKDEWIETLRKDVILRETMYIAKDVLKGESIKRYGWPKVMHNGKE